jgi:hypothetical protein
MNREHPMGDIKDPRLLYLKGFLFLFSGVFASALLLLEVPTLRGALLLSIAVWSFARFYYFAFYVIERYVDPSFKFAGLGSFVSYLLTKKPPSSKAREAPSAPPPSPEDGSSPSPPT